MFVCKLVVFCLTMSTVTRIIPLLIMCSYAMASDVFNEELYLKQLPGGSVYAHFQFTTIWNATLEAKDSFVHFHLFPKSFGEILQKYSVRELHLSLTQGRWRHETWGYPVVSAGPGAELWVWFMESQTKIDEAWVDLVNVLSGSFCASLNFMDSKVTIIPKYGFRPRGVSTTTYDRWYSQHVRHASLPREIVCTENLTPWKKLLPCGSKAGISTLLNAARLYDSSYHSLAIDFRPVCRDVSCQSMSTELSQSLSLVFDPSILTQTLSSRGKWDWSLKKLFGRMISSACPLATTSAVYLDVSSNITEFSVKPEPSRYLTTTRGSQQVRYAVFDVRSHVSDGHVLNVDVKHAVDHNSAHVVPSILTASRFQTGHGRSTGGIMCLIHNSDPLHDVIAVYQEVVPWYLRVYLHTLKVESFPNVPQSINAVGVPLKPLQQYYLPGKDRTRSYQLELVLKLPANSVTRVSFEFERQLLKWTEYPPDANHGFYVSSAVISTLLPDAVNYTAPGQASSTIGSIFENSNITTPEYFIRMYTEPLLVSLPTPDFSMPYNVICLACTVVAIAFGSIHNLTTRRFVRYDEQKHAGLLTRVRQRLAATLSRFRRSKTDDQPQTTSTGTVDGASDSSPAATGDNDSNDDNDTSGDR